MKRDFNLVNLTSFSLGLILLSFLFLSTSCSVKENFSEKEQSESLIEEENHIHTIAFDPSQAGVMYLATHYYLKKVNMENKEEEEIGKYGNDYMGFLITSNGKFYSSGHSKEIPNVGIRVSQDKGKSWQTLAYEGYDFHEMATSYADPQTLYALSTPPEEFLAISKDGGVTWKGLYDNEDNEEMQGLRGSIFALEADKQKPERLYAGTLFGLFISENGGKNWTSEKTLQNIPIIAITDHPLDESKIILATPDQILQSRDGGNTWQEITFAFNQKEELIVFLSSDPATGKIYGVTKHSKIYVFEEGKEWEEFSLKN